MKMPKIISCLMLIAVILGAVWLVFSASDKQGQNNITAFQQGALHEQGAEKGAEPQSESPIEPQSAGQGENIKENQDKAELIIDNGSDTAQSFDLEVGDDATAFSLLQDTGLDIEFQQYDFGVFVEGIGGVENGQDDKYWLFYVNGEMPMVSADNQVVEPGDKIDFKFEASQF